MRNILAIFLFVSMIGLTSMVVAQEKKAAPKLILQNKYGNVTFDHAAHSAREKEDCKVCHDALWPQDAKAPLNYKAAAHKTAEQQKKSCGFCHVDGGKAFAAKGNCTTKCHKKG